MPTAVAKIFSAELEGVTARRIEVEVDINIGLASFTIVGLADKAVSEAKERVSSALKNCGAKPPTRENRRITVNLAPADVKKQGSQHDVAIALGYLVASGQIEPFETKQTFFVGELALDGSLRPVPGVLNACRLAQEESITEVFIPWGNAREAALIDDVLVYPVRHLKELVDHLEGRIDLAPVTPASFESLTSGHSPDISEIRGQGAAKRALAIAAAGGHNIFMSGPPGAGKTMLAQSLLSILPPLSREEALDVTQIYSAAGMLLGRPFVAHRPFRSPHHSASLAAVVGGGQNPRPGEVSLAHRGVLFLDEFPEFHRDVLESLRQPLEAGNVMVSRAKSTLTFPARFMLVAASNPCPCGYWGDEEKECKCTGNEIAKYQKKLSGPLLDRIDIHIWVDRVRSEDLKQSANVSESVALRSQIDKARAVQCERFAQMQVPIFSNAELSSAQIQDAARLTPPARELMEKALDTAHVSARGFFKMLKVARTIADMEGKEETDEAAVSEAFSYRTRNSE